MKRIAALLICLILLMSTACAEEVFTALTSMDGFFDTWIACSANDSIPYLILHEDGTCEMYDWWMFDDSGTDHALLWVGSYTFDPSNGQIAFEGTDSTYTLKTALSAHSYTTCDDYMTMFSGQPLLMLEAPPVDGMEQSMLFMGEEYALLLLPSEDDMSIAKNGWSVITEGTGDTEVWMFTEEEVTYPVNGENRTCPYTLDRGRMTLTEPGGSTRTFLMQYSYTDVEQDGIQQLATSEAIELAQETGWRNVETLGVIRLTELEGGKPGKVRYLTSSEPLTYAED